MSLRIAKYYEVVELSEANTDNQALIVLRWSPETNCVWGLKLSVARLVWVAGCGRAV